MWRAPAARLGTCRRWQAAWGAGGSAAAVAAAAAAAAVSGRCCGGRARGATAAAEASKRAGGGGKFPRAVRPLPMELVIVARPVNRHVEALAAEYGEKIRRYVPRFEESTIRPNPGNASDPASQRAAEGERVIKRFKGGEFCVVLDERGKALTSEGLADLVAEAPERGARSIVFCVGGPYGHDDSVREGADAVVSLSGCVLNHAVARLVLLEQIYRAWTIIKGEKYHH